MTRRLSLILATAALFIAACAPAAAPRSEPSTGTTSASAPASAPAPTMAAQAKPAEAVTPAAAPAASPAAAPAAGVTAADRAVSAPAAQPAAPGAQRAAAAAPAPAPAASPVAKPADSQASQTPNLPQVSIPNRMIIYNTSLTLLVKTVEGALRMVGDLAVLHGGYVAGVENGSENGLPFSIIRIKVLPDRYQATMNALRDGGLSVEVRDEKATTQDVTEEYSDVQTQLASLEATHRQLLDLLAKATTMDEILKIQQQANQVKLQIDRLKGRATALERLSELATITVKLQLAEAVLGKDYVAVRSQHRQAQSQYAAQLLALKRARTPEEEAKIRDLLAELQLQVERTGSRMKDLEQKAVAAGVALPTAPPEETATAAPSQELPEQYIEARVALRRAEARQAEIMRRLKLSLPPDEADALRKELSEKVLEVSSLGTRLRTIQERANQLGVTLPTLTPEQEAALAGTTVEVIQPDPWRAVVTAWDASLAFLRSALAALLGGLVFLWWAIPLLALAAFAASGRIRARWPFRPTQAAPAPAPPAAP